MGDQSIHIAGTSISTTNGQTIIANNFTIQTTSNRSVTLPYRFRLPDPVANFSGRDLNFERIAKSLENSTTVLSEKNHPIKKAISGLGGVGKTELVKKYAEKYSDTYPIIIYLIADNSKSLEDAYIEVANDFGIRIINDGMNNQKTPRRMNDVLNDLYKALILFGNTLVIFDNADDANGIIDYLPCRSVVNNEKKLHVLITSRDSKWNLRNRGNIEVITIDVFTSEEAFNFMKNSLDENLDIDNDISELCEMLQFLPLALNQAIGYINTEVEKRKILNKKYSIREYIDEYQCSKSKFLEYTDDDSVYNSSVKVTWRITIEKLKTLGEIGEIAIAIFESMCYYPPDEIPVKLFVDDLTSEAVSLLKRYHLINGKDNVFKMHRLVQETTKIYISDEKRDKIILEKLVKQLSFLKNITPLMYSCGKNMIEVIKYILDNDYDVSVVDSDGETAIFYVSDVKTMKMLVQCEKFELNLKNKNGYSIWMLSIIKNNVDLIKYLSTLNIYDINERDDSETTAYMYACLYCEIETIKFLYNAFSEKIELNAVDNIGRTLLSFAVQSGDICKINCLINDLKLNLNERDSIERTMLMYACTSNSIETVEFILSNCGNTWNDTDSIGYTPLLYASRYSSLNMVQYLINNYKLELNDKDIIGSNLLMHAFQSGDMHKVLYFVNDHKFSLYEKNNFDWTMLMFACMSDNVDLVKYVLENSANCWDDRDIKEMTPLMWASFLGSIDVVRYAIESYGNNRDYLSERDINGKTALDYARKSGNESKIAYMENIFSSTSS